MFAEHDSVADVVVIGAGISGLSAALAVHRAGLDIVVLERRGVAGGVIRSSIKQGVLAEAGPNSFHSNATIDALLHSLGLDGEKIFAQSVARKRFVLRHGTLCEVPASPRSLLVSPLLSFAGKARAVSELFVPQRESSAEESLAHLIERRFGREVLDYLGDPLVSGIYAGDPARLSAAHALPVLSRMAREHGSVLRGMLKRRGSSSESPRGVITTFRSGMQMLPAAIASELNGCVRYRSVVNGIVREGGAWTVSGTNQNGPFSYAARRVIVAVPAHALNAIMFDESVTSLLSPVRDVRYASVATVALSYSRSQVAHPLDGLGVLIPRIERRQLLGVLFNSSTFCCRVSEGTVLLTAFLGDAVVGDNSPVDAIQQLAASEVSQLLGIHGPPLGAHCTVWPLGIPQYELGYDAILHAAANVSRDFPGLQFVGSYLNGVSVGDCIANGTEAGNAAVRALG